MFNPKAVPWNLPVLAIVFLACAVAAQDGNPAAAETADYWVEVEKFRSNVMSQRAELISQYETELLSSLGPLLDPSRLRSDKDFSESRELLEKGRSVVEKYESIFLVAFDNSADQVQHLNLSEAEKRRVVTAYERDMAQSKIVHREIWRLERQKIREIESIVELLADNPGSWATDGGHIVFDEPVQLSRWNERFANIEALDREQMRLRKAAIEAQRKQTSAL